MTDTLKPDSQEAVESGCTCPVTAHQDGARAVRAPDWYVINPTCPLHGFDDGEEVQV